MGQITFRRIKPEPGPGWEPGDEMEICGLAQDIDGGDVTLKAIAIDVEDGELRAAWCWELSQILKFPAAKDL
jgi:hypothetical protein